MESIDFKFELPKSLIAAYPLSERSASRLLVLNNTSKYPSDLRIRELPSLLDPGDLLIFNDTKVIPARLPARKKISGGKVEIFVEKICSESSALVRLKASKRPQIGSTLLSDGDEELIVRDQVGEFFLVEMSSRGVFRDLLEVHGQIPLPPYISRPEEPIDRSRYQTIFAETEGAVDGTSQDDGGNLPVPGCLNDCVGNLFIHALAESVKSIRAGESDRRDVIFLFVDDVAVLHFLAVGHFIRVRLINLRIICL